MKFLTQFSLYALLLAVAACQGGGAKNAAREKADQPMDWLSVQEEYQRMQQEAQAEYERQKEERELLAKDANAQFEKGKSLCCGDEDGKDTKQATQWLCMAARRDHPDAQYEMGNIYRSDKENIERNLIGVSPSILRAADLPKDDFMAYFWYSQAFKFEHPDGENQANMLLPRLSEGDLVKLRDFRKRYPAVPCEVKK